MIARRLRSPATEARLIRSRANALHDAGLIRRFNTGDESAFAEIVTRHRESLCRTALSLLKNRADAEEMAQDALVRAYRGLALFRGESSLISWLQRIVRNLSLNRYWYFFRRHRHLTESFDCPLGSEGNLWLADLVPSDAASPVREATHREFALLVARCMGQLSSRHREILELRNVQQQSYRQIAGALGITKGTVKSRIARARASLFHLLLAAYDTPTRGATPATAPWFETIHRPGRFSRTGA